MAEISKCVLVAHPASRMFALVDAVEKYPEFLPWCSATKLIYRDAQITRATLYINFRGIRHSFSTENPKCEPQWMQIKLIEGPFKVLEGSWRFSDLDGVGCKVELTMRYEFASRLLEKLMGPPFSHIANSLVDAFVKRARSVYG